MNALSIFLFAAFSVFCFFMWMRIGSSFFGKGTPEYRFVGSLFAFFVMIYACFRYWALDRVNWTDEIWYPALAIFTGDSRSFYGYASVAVIGAMVISIVCLGISAAIYYDHMNVKKFLWRF